MSSGVTAGLKTGLTGEAGNRGGSKGGAGPTARVGPGSIAVKASQGSQRPNYIVGDIYRADAAYNKPENRKGNNWI